MRYRVTKATKTAGPAVLTTIAGAAVTFAAARLALKEDEARALTELVGVLLAAYTSQAFTWKKMK